MWISLYKSKIIIVSSSSSVQPTLGQLGIHIAHVTLQRFVLATKKPELINMRNLFCVRGKKDCAGWCCQQKLLVTLTCSVKCLMCFLRVICE